MGTIIEQKELRNRTYIFRDRFHAGALLAKRIHRESLVNPIVLAIPSGGVPVGSTIAQELGIPLDLIIVRKIPVPYNPEAGFGSVSWDGDTMLNEGLVSQLGLTSGEIESAVQEVKRELKRREETFRGKRPFPPLNGRTVIIVDDGLASGYTMLSSIRSIRKRSPARIIAAVPTASQSAVELVSSQVDELVCLNIRDTPVYAVADAYRKWHDLTEQEVREILQHFYEPSRTGKR